MARRQDAPWIWIALLAAGVVAVGIVVIALAATGDDEDGTQAVATDGATTVVVVEDDGETDAADDEAAEGDGDGDGTSVIVPEVVGLEFAAAGREAWEAGLIADSYPVDDAAPPGTVVAQSPEPGTNVASTRRLRLEVSTGPDPLQELRVPDLTGPPAPRAREMAWEQGFSTITADRDAPTAEEVGEVILQEPAAGSTVPALTQITLYVGR